MSLKPKFVDGERVLCFHGPLIYEAKALKSTITKDKQVKYYIHYAGWNKNWDEWVPENRVLKYNEANVQRQKEVFKQHSSTARKTKKGSSKSKKSDTGISTTKDSGASSGGSESRASTPSKESNTSLAAPTSVTISRGNRSKQLTSTSDSATNKKDDVKIEDSTKDDKEENVDKKKRTASNTSYGTANGTGAGVSATGGVGATMVQTSPNSSISLELCVESEESFLSNLEVKIKIPDELKQCLADDWDAITRQHKLLDIPAKITVQDIIDQYMIYKKAAKSTNISKEFAITDVLTGVVEYFNVILGSQLLYKFERPQYAEILQQHPTTPLSKLYGAFHFLRLFIKLGPMLTFTTLDEKGMHCLLIHLHDLLKFLVKNSATYFSMSNFVNVSPEYHRNT